MICYKDRTFCNAPNCRCPDEYKLTPEVVAAAERWWGKPRPPIAMGCLCRPSTVAAELLAGLQEFADDLEKGDISGYRVARIDREGT